MKEKDKEVQRKTERKEDTNKLNSNKIRYCDKAFRKKFLGAFFLQKMKEDMHE